MFNLKTNRIARWAAIFALMLVVLLPSATFAGQKRGRGNDDRWQQRGRINYKRDWKKLGKFRNGHDARDGRWDRRRNKVKDRFENRFDRKRGRDNDDNGRGRGKDDDGGGRKGRGRG